MKSITASRSPRRRPRAGWSGVPWLVVLCLVLKSGVPMLAAAAAQLRGVGVAEVCPVYGVALAPVSAPVATGMHGSMVGMAAGDGGLVHVALHGGHGLHGVQPGGHGDTRPAGQPHEHHGDLASGHDHCVLTPLLGAAALAASAESVGCASAPAAPPPASPSFAAPLHDATLAWYARDAHPPPG